MKILVTFTLMSLLNSITALSYNDNRRREWSGNEHLLLGDLGAQVACKELHIDQSLCPGRSIHRSDGLIEFSYGEIIAAADFYKQPNDFDKDTHFGIIPMLDCIHVSAHKKGTEHCLIVNFLNMPGYVNVISNNFNHFGWNNIVAYVHFHQIALDRGKESYLLKKTNSKKSKKLFNQALILNAFADHYLTDAFASGHIRVPRWQIQKWATSESGLSGLYSERRGNILSMILHDFESRNITTNNEEGFLVQNSMGEEWITGGDDHLLSTENSNDRKFQLPLSAIEMSFKELLISRNDGLLPNGIFQAILLVPFHRDVSLEEKLSTSFQKMELNEMVNAIYSFYPFYFQMLFEKKDFYLLLNNINSIFSDFRKDIESDLNTDPNLELRLPTAYIEAYRNVN